MTAYIGAGRAAAADTVAAARRAEKAAHDRAVRELYGPPIPAVWAAIRKAGSAVAELWWTSGRAAMVSRFTDDFYDPARPVVPVATLKAAIRDQVKGDTRAHILIATTPDETVAHVAAEFERLDMLAKRAKREARAA